MKPSREEVLRIASECGLLRLYIVNDNGNDWRVIDVAWPEINRFAAAMYEAGAAAERAVSDRLLVAMKNRLTSAMMNHNTKEAILWLQAAIAEIEAMKKEQE